jgi:hypothetical protein
MNILTSARYNNNDITKGLSNEALHQIAPSIFAEQAANDRSHRYSFIPTHSVVDALRNEGFYPVSAMESRARIEEKTLNRVQENMIRGGVRGRNVNGGRMSTRAVNSVTENVRLNKALWTLADEMAKILK